MSAKTLLFVTHGTPDGREGFRSAIEIASRLGAGVALLVVGGRPAAVEQEGLLRAAAYAEAGYYPGLRERLDGEVRAASVRAAELRAWFVREAAAAGVGLEIRDDTGDAADAVGAAVASTPDLCQVLFSPLVLRKSSCREIGNLALRLDHAVIAIADRAGATP